MFSCIKRKNKDEGNNERRQSGNPNKPKDSFKGITKQLKGLALKVTGGSSSGQNKESKELSEQQNIDIRSYDEIHRPPPPPPPPPSPPSPPSPRPYPRIEIIASSFDDPANGGLFFIAVPNLGLNPPRGLRGRGGGSHYHYHNSSANANANAAAAAAPEFMAHVEEGVSIAFVFLPTTGGNDLRRIRFSRNMFNPELAGSWWTENYGRIMALYNVESLNGEAVIPPPHQEWSSVLTFGEQEGATTVFQHHGALFNGLIEPPPPTLTPTNSLRIDPQATLDVEWVQQDEPGVFITINKSADGTRHIRRIRFSRQQFGTEDARNWWLENKQRVEAQYL